MEWKSGMKVRCIEEYGYRKVGDIKTLTERYYDFGWEYEEKDDCHIDDLFKKNWEVVDMDFTKDDLKVGMLVETRNGQKYIVMNNNKLLKDDGYISLDEFNNDLKQKRYDADEFDFMKVYDVNHNGWLGFDWNCKHRELLWERKEVKELTMEDLEREYGCKVKIVKE